MFGIGLKNNSTFKLRFLQIAIFLILGLAVLSGTLSGRKAYASTASDALQIWNDVLVPIASRIDNPIDTFRRSLCEPTKVVYEGIMLDQRESSIVRTHYFITAAASLNLIYTTMGTSIDNVLRCIPGPVGWMVNGLCVSEGGIGLGEIDEVFFSRATGEIYCSPIERLFPAENEAITLGKPGAMSLASVATTLYYNNQESDSSVNLAYFIDDRVSKLPVIGQTLAAEDVYWENYRGWFIDEILVAWKIMRNIAYTLLALYIFYVGILIITRKHIDQRTVVSVQYALPKLAIAILLITFSYAIGAVIATNAWVLSHSTRTIVKGAIQNAGTLSDGVDTAMGIYVIGYILIFILLAAISGIGIPVLAVFLVSAFVLLIIVEIKVLILYMKLILSIISAPLEFLWYSIPGSEQKVGTWFKKVFSYALGMVAMRAIFWLTFYIGFLMMTNSFTNASDAGDLVFGFLFGAFIFPIVMIFGLIQSIRAPKKIEAMLMGPPKRK